MDRSSCSRSSRSMPGEVAPEEEDAFAQRRMLQRAQIRVALPQLLGLDTRLDEQLCIGHRRHLQLRQAALACAEEVAWPAQPQVLLRQLEAICCALQDAEPLAGDHT